MVHDAVGHGFSLRMQRRGYRVLQAGSCSPEGLFHFRGGSMSSDFIYASQEAAELREELRLLKEKYEMLETGVEKLKSELDEVCSSLTSVVAGGASWEQVITLAFIMLVQNSRQNSK